MLAADPLDVFSWQELLLRLGSAALIGLLLGLDRELRGKSAGLRTHALVALSSAMIMLSSLMLAAHLLERGFLSDPLRAVQGLSQAIGFIAAGVILVRNADVVNLTTAANIWVAAAIGIACGAGQYGLVIVGGGLAFVVVTVIKFIEPWLPTEKGDPAD